MKAVKIKVPVMLTTGVEVPANSIAVVGEFYLNVKGRQNDEIPAQIPLLLYKDETAYNEGRSPILEIASFNPMIQGNVTAENYETKDAESLAVLEIYEYLLTVYKVSELELINVELDTDKKKKKTK